MVRVTPSWLVPAEQIIVVAGLAITAGTHNLIVSSQLAEVAVAALMV